MPPLALVSIIAMAQPAPAADACTPAFDAARVLADLAAETRLVSSASGADALRAAIAFLEDPSGRYRYWRTRRDLDRVRARGGAVPALEYALGLLYARGPDLVAGSDGGLLHRRVRTQTNAEPARFRAQVRLLHRVGVGRGAGSGTNREIRSRRTHRPPAPAASETAMPRYDDAYELRRRSVLRGGPHARPTLAGPPLGYGYPSDDDEIEPGYYTGGGVYREVTDRPYLAERGLLRRSDWRRLGRRRGRDWDRDPRGEVGGPYVGEYRARLERDRYGRTLSPPEHYRGGWDSLSAYRDPDDPWCGYRFLFAGYQGRRSDRGVGGPRRRRRRRT